jgi:hypothetical protein
VKVERITFPASEGQAFDFTGIGASEGEFANTNSSSMCRLDRRRWPPAAILQAIRPADRP